MSVYIKGMEMPPSCSRCPMLEGDRMDGLCHAASRWLDDDKFWTWYVYPEGDMDDSKPCNCPLVPVPPHGRLIDAETLIDAIIAKYIRHERHRELVFAVVQIKQDMADIINELPTIIPASGGTENE